MKKRDSSIELLKVVAIIFVIISHTTIDYVGESSQYFQDIGIATTNSYVVVNAILKHLGMLGDTLFLVCSAWFLADDDRIKAEKVLKIATDNWFFCIFWLIVITLTGYSVSKGEIISQLLPLTTSINWFVPAYIIYYLFHPAFNIIINNLNKRQLGCGILLFFAFFTWKNIVASAINQFNTRLIGTFILYFIVAYIKRYGRKLNENRKLSLIGLSISLILFVVRSVVLNQVALAIPRIANQMLRFDTFIDPINVCIAIFAFYFVKTFNIQSQFINQFSSYSLLIYVIHGNHLVKHRLYSNYYEMVFSRVSGLAFAYQVLLIIVVLIGSFMLAMLYEKTVAHPIRGGYYDCIKL